MNNWEKEVQGSLLKDEQAVLKSLKSGYTKALEDCNSQIADYMTRIASGDNVQSAVYQMQYQQALKGQLEGVLTNLQTQNFSTISDYLTNSYEKGFVGTMYNLQKQGVPLIMPIDQDQVVRAVTTNSKISKGLYNHLGVSVNKLKTTVTAEVTRGVANGSSWEQIAARVRDRGNVSYNNAARIAKTEGHRIQQASTMDACRKAKEAGADVVKQWDATLDKRTRPDHAKLDGQIREVDKPFEVNGYTADAPGDFGVASEDIHCRCCVLQRAKWALDDQELQHLKDQASYFGLDKTKDFNFFKKNYMKATKRLNKLGESDILSVGDTTDFKGFTEYLGVKYGIKVDGSVESLHFESVKTSMTGVEKVMTEFPQAKATLKRVGTNKSGVMCASYEGEINFNPGSYGKDTHHTLSGMIQGEVTGFHPKNTGVLETGSHEMGHLLERTLIEQANPGTDFASKVIKVDQWNKCTQARDVISEACKNAKKTKDGKGLVNSQLKKQVSGYATKNDSECLAECVGDYVANGEKASALSRAVWKILKERLG